MLKEYKIAVTGASGWVGKNLTEALFQKMNKSSFKKNVFLYASSTKLIKINSKINDLEIKNIAEFYNDSIKNNFDIVFHCAFIVRDHIEKFGISKYIEFNKQITNIVLNGIKEIKNCKLILFSTGAAAPYKKSFSSSTLKKDPYGVLKRQEEIVFNDYIETQVMRIFALSGKYIRKPYRFAISNFILQAKYNKRIKIESRRKIIRGYINAKDLADLSILIALNNSSFKKYPILNAVSDEIELLELAKLIGKKFDEIPVSYNIKKNLSDEVYSASPDLMRLISIALNYRMKNIDQQIDDTIQGINNK